MGVGRGRWLNGGDRRWVSAWVIGYRVRGCPARGKGAGEGWQGPGTQRYAHAYVCSVSAPCRVDAHVRMVVAGQAAGQPATTRRWGGGPGALSHVRS